MRKIKKVEICKYREIQFEVEQEYYFNEKLNCEYVDVDLGNKNLRKIRNEYATPRKTDIKAEITELKIDTTVMIPKEDVIVSVTKEGYVKRVSLRSYDETSETNVKILDKIIKQLI